MTFKKDTRHSTPDASYEDDLDRDPNRALREGSAYFVGAGAVHDALRRITHSLDELGISYAVAGGMALFQHGYRRNTDDVDLLVTKDSLKRIHERLDGRGYMHVFPNSKNLRDTESNVKVEFLVTGQYPGDGKPKSIAFPDPASVAVEKGSIKVLSLPALVELKLASGISDPARIRDLADVVELIKLLELHRDFAEAIHPDVRAKFDELWLSTRATPRRFVTLWRNKWLTADAKSLQDMVAGLRAAADILAAMLADGVTLDPGGGTSDDYAHLVTTDPDVAKKYDMHDEREFFDLDDEDRTEDDDVSEGPEGGEGE